MSVERRVGQIYIDLSKLLSIPDGFSFGEKIALVEKVAGKRIIEITDEEFYEIQKSLIKSNDYYKDEKMTNEEFSFWVNSKVK